jgi:hypothetical protein
MDYIQTDKRMLDMHRKIWLAGVLVLAGFSIASAAVNPGPLVDGEYVSAQKEQLVYCGKPIRLWGINFVCNVKQKMEYLPLSFDRIADAGFNGVRLNLFSGTFLSGKDQKNTYTVPVTVKGSDSDIERLDYSIYLAKQRGMFFWFTFSREVNFVSGDYDVMADDGTRDRWNELIKVSPHTLVYLDPRAERAHQEYAKAILEHVNPYTGKRYADEETIALYEIFNENGFIEELVSTGFKGGVLADVVKTRWNEWLLKRYGSMEKLSKAWGQLNAGESLDARNIEFAPVLNGIANMDSGYQREFVSKDSEAGKYPYARGEDVVRFACDLYIGHTKRFIAFVRSLGKPGMGISVAPIAPTGRYGQNMAAYYGASCGDFISNGSYGFACRAWAIDKKDPLYPFLARVNEPPLMEQPLDLTVVDGKPCLYYEVNDYRPNPYTVEFPMRIATLASQQNLAGVFWFNWDGDGYLPPLKSDADYIHSRLPMPDANYPNAGLFMVNDEVALAAIRNAGTIYLNRLIPPAKKPVKAIIGKDVIFNLAKPLDSIAFPLRYHAWRSGMRLVYDPEGTTKLPAVPTEDKSTRIKMGSYVTFDWADRKGYIEVNSPAVRSRVGFNGSEIKIGDTTITGINRNFTSIGFVAEDGLPLEESTSILVTMVSKSTNTGTKIDPSKMKQQWAPGLAEAVVEVGNAPVIVDWVSANVQAPWLKGMSYVKYDFARRAYAKGEVGDSLEVGKDEPMFYCRLTRPAKPKVVKKILFIGNSITRHGPNVEQLGWNGDWGMAATSQDKDFVHQVYKFLCENNPQITPELQLGQIDEQKMAGYQPYLTFEPDVVVIELGDNYPVPEATVEKLQIPYQKMLQAFRRNNNPLIFCVGTWGNDSERNILIQKACESEGGIFVPIGPLALNPENMAASEGHFTNAGVNWHPGDRGMQRIAEKIWQAIKPTVEGKGKTPSKS